MNEAFNRIPSLLHKGEHRIKPEFFFYASPSNFLLSLVFKDWWEKANCLEMERGKEQTQERKGSRRDVAPADVRNGSILATATVGIWDLSTRGLQVREHTLTFPSSGTQRTWLRKDDTSYSSRIDWFIPTPHPPLGWRPFPFFFTSNIHYLYLHY